MPFKFLSLPLVILATSCTFAKNTPSSAKSDENCSDVGREVPVSFVELGTDVPLSKISAINSAITSLKKPNGHEFQFRLSYCANDLDLTGSAFQLTTIIDGAAENHGLEENAGAEISKILFNDFGTGFTTSVVKRLVCSNRDIGCEKFKPKEGYDVINVVEGNENFVVLLPWLQYRGDEKEFQEVAFFGKFQTAFDSIALVQDKLACTFNFVRSNTVLKFDTLTLTVDLCSGGNAATQEFYMNSLQLTDTNSALPLDLQKPVTFSKDQLHEPEVSLLIAHHNFNDSLSVSLPGRTYKIETVRGDVRYEAKYGDNTTVVKRFECRHFFGCVTEESELVE